MTITYGIAICDEAEYRLEDPDKVKYGVTKGHLGKIKFEGILKVVRHGKVRKHGEPETQCD